MQGEMVLAIETSVEEGSIALVQPDGVVRELSFTAGREPSKHLWLPLQDMMRDVEGLSAVVVGTGPGSYNGSRVGIASGQGIALVKGCPLVGVCSFEAVRAEQDRSLAVGDARRGSYSLQWLAGQRLQGAVRLVDAESFASELADLDGERIDLFTFENVERFPVEPRLQERIRQAKPEAGLLGLAYWNRPEHERRALAAAPTEPFYLREAHITKGKKKPIF
ncbi:MAG: tRNA (adenosine(37)-N6)-threonylcarbamoyltransferase complex dimerization subunit type 1 TsaB [Verrucomicrobiota bacterium JB023]|nr:tRNA (adenosine(37)-N6)-threonylcarbamoyltransferase complex dimerization subunit type 1 TsaB [Verrucomicrobiota bacterium JB023]